jgi:hypothetical protein
MQTRWDYVCGEYRQENRTESNVPSQRASHPGRPGSWWAINVAWQVSYSSMHAPAVAQARDTAPLSSPGRLASPLSRVGVYAEVVLAMRSLVA